ncbi:response regulator [Erythrobacter crassostreae]
MEGKTLAERLTQAREDVEPVETPEDVQDAIDAAHGGEETSGTDAIVEQAKAMRGRFDGVDIPKETAKVCLIVDDSRVIRKVSSKIAKSLGYVPVEAENGHEALARCKKAMPAVVLTDWNMPEMDGIEFVSKLRAIPTPKEPIVMFCTSNGEAKDIHEGIGAGADDYIVKPFDEAALAAKLAKFKRD